MTDSLSGTSRPQVIILAAGSGSRMSSATPKQFMKLLGVSVLGHAIRPFLSGLSNPHIILVLPPGSHEEIKDEMSGLFPGIRFDYAVGGDTRYFSVRNGLACVQEEGIVFVHDAARCLLTADLVRKVHAAALEQGSAIPVIACNDSVRILENGGSRAMDRELIRIVQTPQAFKPDLLLKSFEAPYIPQFTDEASVVEFAGHSVHLVEGEETNFKVTRPADIGRAERILYERAG